jgi:hypothetical protein
MPVARLLFRSSSDSDAIGRAENCSRVGGEPKPMRLMKKKNLSRTNPCAKKRVQSNQPRLKPSIYLPCRFCLFANISIALTPSAPNFSIMPAFGDFPCVRSGRHNCGRFRPETPDDVWVGEDRPYAGPADRRNMNPSIIIEIASDPKFNAD